MAISALASAFACSSVSPSADVTDAESDAGASPDADARAVNPPPPPTPTDASDAFCAPLPVANPLSPSPPYRPPHTRNACTEAQIREFYGWCLDYTATPATCLAWEQASANRVCDDCLVTPASDATWGMLVSVAPGDRPFNIAGCFALALGESNATGCGAARWAFDRCLRASCAVPCPPIVADPEDYNCRELAARTTCSTAAVEVGSKCAALDSDAMVGPLKRLCPLGDSVTLQGFTVAMGTTFCVGGLDAGSSSDAAPDAPSDTGGD